MQLSGHSPLGYIPMPSLRINMASVTATLVDLIFLAIAWEYLGKPHLRIHLWLRTFLTLLGVMWLDVILKKIRDDEGYWQQIEMYIQQRSEAQFSHGVCPECFEKHKHD